MNLNTSLIRLIYNILVQDVETRDNWILTIKKVHQTEMIVKGISQTDYFEHFFNDELSNVHTIKRLWQKVQEDYPALRGDTWEERQRMGGQFVVTIDKNQMTLFSEEEMNEYALINEEG
jgi:hypothetical protein